MCSPLDPVCHVAENIAGSAFGAVVDAMNAAAGKALKTLMTFWTSADVPDLGSPTGVTVWLQARLAYVTSAVAVCAVLIAAGKLALARRAEPGADLGRALTRTALAAVVAVPLVNGLAQASDAWSTWILNAADVRGLGSVALNDLGVGLSLVGSLLIVLSSLFQMAIMVVRGAVVAILVGLLPLSAAASNTAAGRQWFTKITAWLMAFLLVKPAAAMIYAAGMQLESSTDSAQAELSGVFVLLLAIFALPALLRLLVPATAAIGDASGGSMTVAAGGALATGAIALGTAGAGTAAAAGSGGGASSGAVGTPGQPNTGGSKGGSTGGGSGSSGGRGSTGGPTEGSGGGTSGGTAGGTGPAGDGSGGGGGGGKTATTTAARALASTASAGASAGSSDNPDASDDAQEPTWR